MSRQPTLQLQPSEDLLELLLQDKITRARANILLNFGETLSIDNFIQPLGEKRPKEFHSISNITLLELAARKGWWDFVIWAVKNLPELAKSAGYPIGVEEQEQFQMICSTILLFAAMNNQLSAVSALLEYGAEPDRVVAREGKYSGTAALDWAVYHGSEGLVRQLMSAGADPLQVASDKVVTPLDMAIEQAKREEQYWKLIPALTDRVAEDQETVNAYSRALLYATIYGQAEIVIHLLSVGADPNKMLVKEGQFAGWSPLHFAHHCNDLTMAIYLLAAGADPDLAADNGTSFRQLISGKNSIVDNLLPLSSDKRVEMATGVLRECRELFPVRQPKLPGPSGIIVTLLAIRALLAELTLKIALILGIVSKKQLETQPAKSNQHQIPKSLAADRFFAAKKKCREEVERTKGIGESPFLQPAHLTPTH